MPENDNSVPATIDALSHAIGLATIRAAAELAATHRDRLHMTDKQYHLAMVKGLFRGFWATAGIEWDPEGVADMAKALGDLMTTEAAAAKDGDPLA